jgi:ribosomal protein S9
MSQRAKRMNKWSHKVKTVSTFPPPGTFTKPAREVARIMATRKVSPGGLGSAIRMVQMFINRAGKHLSGARRKELEEAKRILQDKRAKSKKKAAHT